MTDSAPALRTFTAYGRRAGSARVRVFDWLDHLEMKATSETFIDTADNSAVTLLRHPRKVLRAQRRVVLAASHDHDGTTFISRQATPFSRGSIEAYLLRRSRHGVYDFDDALMVGKSGGIERLWPKSLIWRSAVGAADVVIAGNEYLAGHAEPLARRVEIIPSCVEPSDYILKTDYSIGNEPRAVWLGSPSTEQYLAPIANALLHSHKAHGLRLTVISAGQGSLFGMEEMTDRVQWSPDTFQQVLADADVGIMPLPEDAWTRGKCAYKLLQYGAAGLPLIGSPVGANKTVLQKANGLAAETTDDWIGAIDEALTASAESRAQRGALALDLVRNEYSFGAWAGKMQSILSGI